MSSSSPVPPAAHLREIQDTQLSASQRLAQIQQKLFQFEEQYLETTHMRGNCLKGWDGYLDYKARNDNGNKKKFKASDKVYSFSSLTSPLPKLELEKDVDSFAAKKWAEFCEQALEEREQLLLQKSKRQKM
ncbi:hypothetical protein BASA81_001391 [Batrachochytrium salamandrivorans]|nr:hypothetical protein BASA81_001391 [Batrachochytrium salamandrivorans]